MHLQFFSNKDRKSSHLHLIVLEPLRRRFEDKAGEGKRLLNMRKENEGKLRVSCDEVAASGRDEYSAYSMSYRKGEMVSTGFSDIASY